VTLCEALPSLQVKDIHLLSCSGIQPQSRRRWVIKVQQELHTIKVKVKKLLSMVSDCYLYLAFPFQRSAALRHLE